MKAVLVTPDAPGCLAIGEAPEPEADSNQAVVAVAAVSLNRGEIRRATSMDAGAPIGWDLAGTVATPARDGSGPARGARVVGFSRALRGWAERVAVPVADLAAVPDAVSLEDAATLPVAGLTALYGLERGERLLGSRVLITGGSGGVGYLACQLAGAMGARVVALVRSAEHEDLVRAAGADVVIVDETGASAAEHAPYRLLLDGVGGPHLGALIRLLREDGRAVLYGVSAGAETPLAIRDLMVTGAGRIDGFHLYRESEYARAGDGLERLLGLVADGRLRTLVSHVEPWERVGEMARALIERRYPGKAVLTLG